MKQKLNIMALMAIVMTMLFSQTAKAADVMYTIYNSSEKTLTFYFKEKPAAGDNETVYVVPTNNNSRPDWNSYSNPINDLIETVVFDLSFDKARPTSCYYWFSNCKNLETITDIKYLHTDNVTNMSYMFNGCSALKTLDLSSFNTSNVTDMDGMFQECKGLTSLKLSENFKTDLVTDMGGMFFYCLALEKLDLSSFNTANVTMMNYMFGGCLKLTSLDLSNFDTANVTLMNSMFSGCSGFTSLNLSSFNTAKVTNMSEMFSGCLKLTDLDLSNFDTKEVTYMESMFSGCSALETITLSSNFTTDLVNNMAGLFYGCSKLTSLDLSSFNTANVTLMNSMFSGCSALETLTLSENFKTDAVKNMAGLFSGCSALKSELLNLSNFNTANVKDMGGMFQGCSGLTSLNLSNFNTAKVTNMSYMFNGCKGLTSLDLSSFNTAKVTKMSNMFNNCLSLTSLDLSSFNTSNVTDMTYMFSGSSVLNTIYVSDKFTTDKVENSGYMFDYCTNLVGAVSYPSSRIDKTYANYKTGYFKTYCKVGDTKVEMCGDPLKCENLTLTDGQDFVAHSPFTATNVSYARTISTNAPKWGSLCLPFKYTPSGFEAYQLTSSDDANNTITLEKIEGSITEGTPVLFKKPENGASLNISAENANIVTLPVEGTATKIGNLKLIGTYQAKTFNKDDKNCFILKDDKLMNPEKLLSNGKVTKVGLNAYRAYMVNETPLSPAPQTYSIDAGEGTTVINSLNIMTGEGAEYYDMTGCRTNRLKKGLNIVRQGGKTMKIIIK